MIVLDLGAGTHKQTIDFLHVLILELFLSYLSLPQSKMPIAF